MAVSADDVPPGRSARRRSRSTVRIREALTPKIRSLIPEEKREKLDELLGADDQVPISARGSTQVLSARPSARRIGAVGRTLLLYPRPSDILWKADGMLRLRGQSARRACKRRPAGAAGRVAGSIPLSGDIIASIGRDAPIASAVSFLGVVAVVVFVVRGWRRRLSSSSARSSSGCSGLAGATMAFGIQ